MKIDDDVPLPDPPKRRGRRPTGLKPSDEGLACNEERRLRRIAERGNRLHLQALETAYGRMDRYDEETQYQ